ncbi:MAG: hypothetical protein FWF96_01285, partial [Kiritimatiellaeota bacterium]|nr:hypothetical protein [Kiritimatiellota bacterium]
NIHLAKDIDLSPYGRDSGFNSGKGWIPIGKTEKSPFKGVFDGRQLKISGFFINDLSLTNSGLFGVAAAGQIKNVDLEIVDVNGDRSVGGVAGNVMRGAVLSGCGVAGNVQGRARVGGVAGEINEMGCVSNCHSTATVTSRENGAGGVAGMIEKGKLVDCSATGTVKGYAIAGGVAGRIWRGGRVENCRALEAVYGNDNVGGVVGDAGGHVVHCHSRDVVFGRKNVGGVVGMVDDFGSVSNCFSIGAIHGSGDNTGGVAGRVFGRGGVVHCYATGAVNSTADLGYTGGVAGVVFNSRVLGSYSTGAVNGNVWVGGLAGYVQKTRLANCYATGVVSGRRIVGGVAGVAFGGGSVENCAALNPIVEASESVCFRVGEKKDADFSGNLAFNGMTGKDGHQTWPDKGAANPDGADITADEIQENPTLRGLFKPAGG